jgi:hypothetical protein
MTLEGGELTGWEKKEKTVSVDQNGVNRHGQRLVESADPRNSEGLDGAAAQSNNQTVQG